MKEVLGAAQLCGTLPRAITLVGVEAPAYGFLPPHVRGGAGSLAEGTGHGGRPSSPAPWRNIRPGKTPMHEVGIMEGALDMARRLMEKRGETG